MIFLFLFEFGISSRLINKRNDANFRTRPCDDFSLFGNILLIRGKVTSQSRTKICFANVEQERGFVPDTLILSARNLKLDRLASYFPQVDVRAKASRF